MTSIYSSQELAIKNRSNRKKNNKSVAGIYFTISLAIVFSVLRFTDSDYPFDKNVSSNSSYSQAKINFLKKYYGS